MNTRQETIVTQIGPYPPPYGGVSTHVQRLRRRLQREGFEVPVWCDPNFKPQGPGIRLMLIRKRPLSYIGWLLDGLKVIPGEIAHFHELRAFSFWIWATVRRGQRVVVTVHNQFMLEQHTFFSRLSRWAVRRVGNSPRCRLIAVNARIALQLRALGVPPEHISVIPAYLPTEDLVQVESLPAEIRAFGERHRPLLAVYGIHCHWLPEWGDLYGYDLSLEALKIIRRRHPEAGLVVLTPNNSTKPYFQELCRQSRQLGVAEHVLWWTDSLPDGSPLWKFCDVYLRPTMTDGDALAVREALAVGTPVVASDASDRPRGTVIFPSRNLDAFVAAIEDAISDHHREAGADQKDRFMEIMRVYSELLPELTEVRSS